MSRRETLTTATTTEGTMDTTHYVELTAPQVSLLRRAILAYTAAPEDGQPDALTDADRAAAKGLMDATEAAHNVALHNDPFWAQFR